MKNKKLVFAGLAVFMFAVVVFTASAATKVILKVEKNGKGTVTSDDGHINCGSKCKDTYYSGGSVVLRAKPAGGFTFNKWTGNACGDSIGMEVSTTTDGVIGSCQVGLTYNKNKTITAIFKKNSSSSSSKSSRSSSSASGIPQGVR